MEKKQPNCGICKWSGSRKESKKVPWFDRWETIHHPICRAQGDRDKSSAYGSSACHELFESR